MPPRPRLIPQTLFGRSLLLLGALVAVAQLGLALFYLGAVQKPRMERYLDSVQAEARAVGLALARLPEAERAGYLAELAGDGGRRRFVTVAPGMASDRFGDPLVGLLLRRFMARIGAGDIVWQRQPERMLWLRLRDAPAPMWMGVAVGGVLADVSTFVLGSALVGSVLALAGAFSIQRRINRPLARLADAAADVAAGRAPPVLDQDGPAEIALVAASFNRMAAALDSHDRERALMLAGVSHDLRTP
ncbi:HAMP domain-containing protein, partial [Derxia lacustris]|uniref:HAMP domain-containing protein n=1 Tax=Derxia lacustris TaxID=764842 RepID=UPI00111C76AC